MASVSLCAVGLALPASKLYRCKEPAISALCFPKRRFGGFAMTEDRVPRHCRLSCFSGNESNSMTAPIVEKGDNDNDVPVPKVAIDQDSDPNATVVEITFGDRLGTLIDTMEALRDLGLNVVKAKVNLDSSGKHNTFCITRADTGRKVDDPELLEAIRLTIINNLLTYHPESSTKLAMGEAFGIMPPKEREKTEERGSIAKRDHRNGMVVWFSHQDQQVDVDIATHIYIYDDGPKRSLLYIETADRPGLLVEIVKQLLDISISVESGEFDTEGLLAKAKFHVSYQGAALIKPMQEVLANSLRYYLRIPATQESSF